MPANENTSNKLFSPVLFIELLGGFRLWCHNHEVRVPVRKCQALLALLALSPQRTLSRDRLRDLLWNQLDQAGASNNLRQALHTLRHRVLEPYGLDVLVVDRDSISLKQGSFRCDLHDMQRDIRSGSPPQILKKNPNLFETILAGLEDIDLAFNTWLRDFRAGVQRDVSDSLRAHLDGPHPLPLQATAAEILLDQDPLDEQACRVMIRHYTETGEPARALAIYQSLWTLLDETFGEEPSNATQTLIVRLKSGKLDTPTPKSGRSDRPSQLHIYVAPIEVSGLDVRDARLADGFRLDLIAGLTRFREWRVFDQQAVAMPQVSDLSGYVVALAVLGGEAQLRFSLLIREIEGGGFIWSERFTIGPNNWSHSQNSIIRRIATALNVYISIDRIERFVGTEDFALDTYDQWLVAHNLVMEYTPVAWARAEKIFEALIHEKPGFARAYASLAGMENTRHMAFPGYHYSPEKRARTMDLARKAVRLDPLDARTQLAFGWSCAMNGDFGLSELAFALAHQNNENDPWTLISAATGLAFCDQTSYAQQLANAFFSLELNPSPMHWSYIAVVHFMAGNFDACVKASERAEEITVDVPAWHAAALAQIGRIDEARKIYARLLTRVRAQWAAESSPTLTAIARWLGDSFPIRNAGRKEAFLDGLQIAGLIHDNTRPHAGEHT